MGNRKQKSNNQRQKGSYESQKNHQKKNSQKQRPKDYSQSSRRKGGPIPCGKRTDFGYNKDFSAQYSLGKLLGHGQFGYTFVGIDKENENRVAVKRLEKSKVLILSIHGLLACSVIFLIDLGLYE